MNESEEIIRSLSGKEIFGIIWAIVGLLMGIVVLGVVCLILVKKCPRLRSAAGSLEDPLEIVPYDTLQEEPVPCTSFHQPEYQSSTPEGAFNTTTVELCGEPHSAEPAGINNHPHPVQYVPGQYPSCEA